MMRKNVMIVFAAMMMMMSMVVVVQGTTNLIDETGIITPYIFPTTINASVSFVDLWGTRPFTMLARQDCHVKEDGSGDSTTIQGCCDIAPWNSPFPYTIYVHNSTTGGGDGIYPEDVKCHAGATTQTSRLDEAGDPWESNAFVLRAYTEHPATCEVWVRSIHMSAVGSGMSPSISNICVYGQTPFDDENSSISVYGGGTHSISGVSFANASRAVNASINGSAYDGIQCYDAKCYIAANNFSLTHYGVKAKYNAMVVNGNTANTGSPGSLCYYITSGVARLDRTLDTCEGGSGYVDTAAGGMAMVTETEGNFLYNLDGTKRSKFLVMGNAPYITIEDTANTGGATLNFKTDATNTENWTLGINSYGLYITGTETSGYHYMHIDDADGQMCFGRGQECDRDFQVNRSAEFEQLVEFSGGVNITGNITDAVTISNAGTSSLLRVVRPGDASHQIELGPSTDDVNVRSRSGEFFASINNDANWFMQTGGGSLCLWDGYNLCDSHTNEELFLQGEMEINSSAAVPGLSIKMYGLSTGLNIDRVDNDIDQLCFGPSGNNNVCLRARGGQYMVGLDNFATYPLAADNNIVCVGAPYNTCAAKAGTNEFYVHGQSMLNGTLQVGDGTVQTNITLTSPDGTEYNCGVANGGTFSCS